MLFRGSILASALLLGGACSHGSSSGDPDGSIGDATPDARGPDGTIEDFSRVYCHTGTTLYRLDTTTLQPIRIGDFSDTGAQSITDIAIDKDDLMYGITLDRVYAIDETDGTTTLLTDFQNGLPNFTSLSFVPVDLSVPDGAEKLVAATDDGSVYEINRNTGGATLIGAYGTAADGTIASSGDIVAVRNFGIVATVTIGLPFSNPDYLAQIDPTTWEATPLGIGTGYDRIFGLAFWRGKIYGFVDLEANGGAIIELNPTTGAATVVNQGPERWYGAGVTTNAPVVD
ncbi:MAG: hypothetical protein KC464_09370 [Myxococcales bacterium]|nr:hypothetical protein [Myxococcales bacterium]